MSEARPSIAQGGEPPAVAQGPSAFPRPEAFRPPGVGPQEILVGQVAFAMAAEAGAPPRDAEAMQSLRDQAAAALSDFAFRYLHNQAEDIRRQAATEALASAGHGPRFLTLVLANLVALAVAGTAGYALAANPQLLARLTGS